MKKKYFLIAIRNLVREKGYSFINVFGLAVGLTGSLLIFLWVFDELSFDRFHENINRIYRVEQDYFYNGEAYHVNVTPYPSGKSWEQEIPEIETVVRYARTGSLLVKQGLKAFYEPGIIAVDSSFFSFFTFPLKAGDPETAIALPFSMVLTEEIAQKYFGKENPLGKSVRIDNQYDFTITGILKEIPCNSSISPDILVHFDFTKTLGIYDDGWSSNSIQTFVMLAENADCVPVDNKLTEVVKSHFDFEAGEEENFTTRYMLAPMKERHLHGYSGFGHPPGQIQNIVIFITIGIFILLIASINYLNLSTARSSRRAKEIGLRKTAGANRKSVVFQFMCESLVTTVLAGILAVILINILFDWFNQLAGKEIEQTFLYSWKFFLGLIGSILFTGLLAGTYPAIFLSGFRPVKALKGTTGDSPHKAGLRKILVVVQFTVSIFLITGSLLVYKQLNHMQTKKIGYDKEHVLYIRMFGDINQSYNAIYDGFERIPGVVNISASSHLPGYINSNSGGADWEGKDPDLSVVISMAVIDFNYTQTLKIPIIQGRTISKEFPSDIASDSIGSFLVNEEVVKIMGVDNPVGMRFSFLGIDKGRIVGVMKNFHFLSMKDKIEPLAITAAPKEYLRYIIIRISPFDINSTLKQLDESWKRIMPDYPFDNHFLDEDYKSMYRSEQQMGILLKYFALMSVFIALLGLFGLATYLAETRTKEIGIRKILGSSISNVVYLLTGEFTKLVLIAIAIGVPVSWYFLDKWLQDYAYPTQLSWWIFVIAALFSILVEVFTVSLQAFLVANKNPAHTLRHE